MRYPKARTAEERTALGCAPGTFYDAAGNLTNWNGAVYLYDHFNQMTPFSPAIKLCVLSQNLGIPSRN